MFIRILWPSLVVWHSLPLVFKTAQEQKYRLMTSQNKKEQQEIAHRADEALRRALNTPPKQHKNMKKGKGKQRDKPATPPQKP